MSENCATARALFSLPTGDESWDDGTLLAALTIAARLHILFLAILMSSSSMALELSPTYGDVRFGPHAMNTLDIYRPHARGKVPAVMFVHAGGWWNGDKRFLLPSDVAYFTDRGIAYVSINYRNLPTAAADKIFPPVLGPLRDTRRALQYLRAHADTLEIDPSRISIYGESAGGFNALWLGLGGGSDDASSSDRVTREPTDVRAIGAMGAQTSIDPEQMREWVGPQLKYGGHAFGLAESDFDQFLARRGDFKRFFALLSPAELVNAGSPPIFLLYTHRIDPDSTDQMYYVHSPLFGVGFVKVAAARHANVKLVIDPQPAARTALFEFLAASVKD